MTIALCSRWPSHSLLGPMMNQIMELSAVGDQLAAYPDRWVPAIDLKENADHYTLFVDLPGVAPEQIVIETDNGYLSVQAERLSQKELADTTFLHQERRADRFYRRLALPEGIDVEGITARSQFGVLELRLPKTSKVKPRRIQVDDKNETTH